MPDNTIGVSQVQKGWQRLNGSKENTQKENTPAVESGAVRQLGLKHHHKYRYLFFERKESIQQLSRKANRN